MRTSPYPKWTLLHYTWIYKVFWNYFINPSIIEDPNFGKKSQKSRFWRYIVLPRAHSKRGVRNRENEKLSCIGIHDTLIFWHDFERFMHPKLEKPGFHNFDLCYATLPAQGRAKNRSNLEIYFKKIFKNKYVWIFASSCSDTNKKLLIFVCFLSELCLSNGRISHQKFTANLHHPNQLEI